MLVLLIAAFVAVTLAQGIEPGGCQKHSGSTTACLGCVEAGCGYCSSSRTCMNGTSTGPSTEDGRQCLIGWIFGDKAYCPNCAARTSCTDCQSSPDCVACQDNTCQDLTMEAPTCTPKLNNACSCSSYEHCSDCTQNNECTWCQAARKCFSNKDKLPAACPSNPGACPACDTYQNCQFCSQQAGCGWCGGSCKEVTFCTQLDPPLANCDEYCKTQKSCEACIFSLGCGWCSDGTDAGHCEGFDQDSSCTRYQITCPRPGTFDGGSFVGGMALILGLGVAGVLGFFIFRYYRRRSSYSSV